jgi:hypothetical protein
MALFAANVIEFVVKGTLPTTGSGTKNVYNVFHYWNSSGLNNNPLTAAQTFNSAVQAVFAAQLSVDYTYVTTMSRFLDDATVQYLATNTNGISGAIALPRLPSETAIVTPFVGVQRGKNFRGSKHFAGIPTASVTKDELNAGAVAAWATVVSALAATINDGGATYQPIVLSRSLSQLRVNPTTLVGSLLSNVLLNKTIGGMRRRKEKTVR